MTFNLISLDIQFHFKMSIFKKFVFNLYKSWVKLLYNMREKEKEKEREREKGEKKSKESKWKERLMCESDLIANEWERKLLPRQKSKPN